jgi:para-nitrobenzyl esterase
MVETSPATYLAASGKPRCFRKGLPMALVVVTTSEGAVRGIRSDDGVAAFKGIPYAAPPVGRDHLRPPRPPLRRRDVLDAVAYGPTVAKAPYRPPFDRLIPEVEIRGEDSLNLNVWTPDPGGSAPVMVWLHGGGFLNGSGSVPCYDGSAFARDGVVLVTLNYRLGAPGYLYLGDGPANMGLLDQISALTWVRENIAAFGGDPARVTVFGESAGAMSIGTLLATPAAEGLFHRAILQSGAAHQAHDARSALLVTARFAEMLGIEPTRAAFEQLDTAPMTAAQPDLRAMLWSDPDPARWGATVATMLPFEPVVDGVVLPRDPAEVIARGEGHDVQVLIGCNLDEFRLFTVPTGQFGAIPEALARATAARYGLEPARAFDVYRAARPAATPGELHARLVTDWIYRIPAVRLAEAYARRRPGSVYAYEFTWQPSAFDGMIGACHGAEVPFVFDNLADDGFHALLGSDLPQKLADTMHAAWIGFARDGDPGWAGYGLTDRTTMMFDLESEAVADPRPEERRMWEGLRD